MPSTQPQMGVSGTVQANMKICLYIYIGINQVPPQCKSSLHDKQNDSANTQLQFPGIINVVTRSVHQVNKSAVFSVLRHHPKS